ATADWAVLTLVGPGVAGVLSRLGVVEPPARYRVVSLAGGGWARRMPPLGDPLGGGTADVADLVVPRGLLPAAAGRPPAAGAGPARPWAFRPPAVAAPP